MNETAIALIVARADNGVIGAAGGLPWHLPSELAHFKALTMGKPVVMGRRTWDSLPKKPLPGRDNIVVTRNETFDAPGARVAASLDNALALAKDAPEIMVIGGAELYFAALPLARRIYLTEVHARPEGDTLFPPLSSDWRETAREERAENDLRFSYVTLERA